MNLQPTASAGATAARRRWSDVGRGMAAMVGVLALALGVPAGLVVWVGWPLPAGVPRVDEVADALRDTYVPDEFLIKALALVCWLVWVELMVALVVEAIAYAHGRQAGRVPLAAAGVQRAAARLVATAALLGALAATRGVPDIAGRALAPPPTANLVVADPSSDPAAVEVGASNDADAPDGGLAHPVYEVQPRDTLWRIAECHLGDPFRWPEIYELNRGVAQADGRVLHDGDLIHPGWQLRLPTDATGLETPAPAGADEAAGPGTASLSHLPAEPTGPGDHHGPATTGASGADGGMVLLDEDDLLDTRGPGPDGELVAGARGPAGSPGGRDRSAAPAGRPAPDGRAGPRSPTGSGSGSGGSTAPAGATGAAADDSARPDDDPGGMVLLPDDELPPPTDGWLVAGADE